MKFINYFVDEASGFISSVRDAFWEVADRAERTRSRLRLRRIQCGLADRESALSRQLGQMGYAVLKDGVSVRRTPEVTMLLDEMARLDVERQRHESRLATELSAASPAEWRRLSQLLDDGSCAVTSVTVMSGARGCGRSLIAEIPPGMCLAIKRGETWHVPSAIQATREGDCLLIFAPLAAGAEWKIWAGDPSTRAVN